MLQGHRHSPRKPAGQWRRGPVYVTDARDPSIAAYAAPEADAVSALMAELVEWLETADGAHPLVRAAMAHLHLVSIHLGRRKRPDVALATDADDRAGRGARSGVLFDRGMARAAG